MTGLERWRQRRWTASTWLERLALAIEHPVNRLIGNTQLNPFYHTGTIAVFLLGVVAVTGFYIFLFYQYGFEASHYAVMTRIETPFIARLVRAIHRYASGALVITTLLHAYRMLFMERFRGPRWLAWLTGIFMTFILWLAGITGYWLVWDERAQLINEHFIDFLAQVTQYAPRYLAILFDAERTGESWPLFFLLLVIHVALFLLTAVLTYLHLRHLKRPRWIPEAHWMIGAGVVLLVVSAFFPAGFSQPASFDRLPDVVRLDPIFLYYLPVNETGWSNFLWAGMWLGTIALGVLPLTRPRDPVALVQVIDEKCTGCTKCAKDCPYGALEMVPRNDNTIHQLIAVADPSKCVGCGICVGSCDDFFAIKLGDQQPEQIGQVVRQRIETIKQEAPEEPLKVIFTCERHAAQGAKSHIDNEVVEGMRLAVLPLPCTGTVQPMTLPSLLEAGADEVAVVGCPPFDCANREGNLWQAERVTHERVPRLRKRFDHSPITAQWLPPDMFEDVIPLTAVTTTDTTPPDYLSQREMFRWLTWRNLLVGFVLLALVLVGQVWLTGLPFDPTPDNRAMVRVLFTDPSLGMRVRDLPALGDEVRVTLWLNETAVAHMVSSPQQLFSREPEPFFADVYITPAVYDIRLDWHDEVSGESGIIYAQQQVELSAGEILRIHDVEAELQLREKE